jgi:hypothetical protein
VQKLDRCHGPLVFHHDDYPAEVIAPEDLWQTKVGALQDSCDRACLREHLLADYSHARGVRLDEEIERENYAPVVRFEERATV